MSSPLPSPNFHYFERQITGLYDLTLMFNLYFLASSIYQTASTAWIWLPSLCGSTPFTMQWGMGTDSQDISEMCSHIHRSLHMDRTYRKISFLCWKETERNVLCSWLESVQWFCSSNRGQHCVPLISKQATAIQTAHVEAVCSQVTRLCLPVCMF